MKFTENYSLPCLDDEDYGAIALYMQRLAQETENVLVSQRTEAEFFNQQPTDIFIMTSPSGTLGAGTLQLNLTPTNCTVFQNYTPTLPGTSNQPFSASNNNFPMPGIYHVGFNANTQAVGAVNVGTFRQIRMVLTQFQPAGEAEIIDFSRKTFEENATGGNFIGVSGLVALGADFTTYGMFIEFSHENTSSEMFVATGSYFWRTRIGSTNVIEVT